MLLSEPGKVIRCADHLQVLLALPAETIDLILAAPGKQEFFQKGRPSDYLFRRTAVELLRVLKPGGVLAACLYSGGPNGSGEKRALLEYFRGLPPAEYTLLVCEFANWVPTAPLPCFVLKK